MRKSLVDYSSAGCAVEMRNACEGRKIGLIARHNHRLYVWMLVSGEHYIPVEKISMRQVSKVYGKYTVFHVIRTLQCSVEELTDNYEAFAEALSHQTPCVDTDSVISRMLEAGDIVEARLYEKPCPVNTLMVAKNRAWGMCLQDLAPNSDMRWLVEYIPDCRISKVYRGVTGDWEKLQMGDYEKLKRQVAELEPLVVA